jgi:hypothetical protein
MEGKKEKEQRDIAQVSKLPKGEEEILYKTEFFIHPPYTHTCTS